MKSAGRIRIVAGQAGGLFIQTPRKFSSRPTQERVREALFSSIAPILPGARFVDAYAGSGAVGIEALSRGAGSCLFLEKNREAARCIENNLKFCRLEGRIFSGDAVTGLANLPGASVDILFLDPPYEEGVNVLDNHPALPEATRVIHPEGLIIWEHSREKTWDSPPDLEIVRTRKHGETRLTTLKRKK